MLGYERIMYLEARSAWFLHRRRQADQTRLEGGCPWQLVSRARLTGPGGRPMSTTTPAKSSESPMVLQWNWRCRGFLHNREELMNAMLSGILSYYFPLAMGCENAPKQNRNNVDADFIVYRVQHRSPGIAMSLIIYWSRQSVHLIPGSISQTSS